jgi:hypothetical protein
MDNFAKNIRDIVDATLPTREGNRRDAMFRFARALKAVPRYRRVPVAQVEPAFREWYTKALPFITQKDYERNWAAFQRMWGKVKHPADHVSLKRIVELADSSAPLPSASRYKSAFRRRLVAVCYQLHVRAGGKSFPLDSRSAGEELGVRHTSVLKALHQFHRDGVVRRVERGRPGGPDRKGWASKYRYIGGGMNPLDGPGSQSTPTEIQQGRHDMDSLSEQLREAVRTSGASQADVASTCGIGKSQLSRFLSGDGSLSLHAADRLASCLRLRLVREREWQRRDVVWQKYELGELRRKGDWDEY